MILITTLDIRHHFCLYADTSCIMLKVHPSSFISFSADLHHVCFGYPLFLFQGGLHLKAILGISDVSFLETWPILF